MAVHYGPAVNAPVDRYEKDVGGSGGLLINRRLSRRSPPWTRAGNQRFDPSGNLLRQEYQPAGSAHVLYETGILPSPLGQLAASRSFDWNGQGKLGRVTIAGLLGTTKVLSTFAYGPGGQRVAQEQEEGAGGDPVSVRRFGDFFELTSREGQTDWTIKVRFGGKLVAWRDHDIDDSGNYDEQLRYVAGDHLGSASIITDDLGELHKGIRYVLFSEWDQIFKDPMTTVAAIDRVVHHSVILELTGTSYRSDEATKRQHERATTEPPKP